MPGANLQPPADWLLGALGVDRDLCRLAVEVELHDARQVALREGQREGAKWAICNGAVIKKVPR